MRSVSFFTPDAAPNLIRNGLNPALFIGDFYSAERRTVDARYLAIEKKYGFDGVGLFASQLLTDDLAEHLATGNFEQRPNE